MKILIFCAAALFCATAFGQEAAPAPAPSAPVAAYTNLVRAVGFNGFTEKDVATTAATLKKLATMEAERLTFQRGLGMGGPTVVADPDDVTALSDQFADACDKALPENPDGEMVFAVLFFKNKQVAMLQMANLYGSEDAFVGFVELKSGRLELSPPALVPGLGSVVASAAAALKPTPANK